MDDKAFIFFILIPFCILLPGFLLVRKNMKGMLIYLLLIAIVVIGNVIYIKFKPRGSGVDFGAAITWLATLYLELIGILIFSIAHWSFYKSKK